MLKRIIPLIFTLAVFGINTANAVPPVNAIAMPAGTPMAQNTPGNAVSQACDQFGVCANSITGIVPGTGATDLGKAEDSASTSGFTGVAPLAVYQASPGNLVGTDGDYAPISTNGVGAVVASIYRSGASTDPVKAEDAAAASGDALVGVAGVVNTTIAAKAADGDYTGIALDTAGQVFLANGVNGLVGNTGGSITGSGVAGAKLLAQAADPLALGTGVIDGDATTIRTDLLGRTITTLAPAGESWQACSAQATGVGDVPIKAAVASNRIYVTNLNCSNDSIVPSRISFKDGSTVIAVGGIGALSTSGSFQTTFPVPLRGTSNTALNFAMQTTSTATICCASGYISVN